MRFATAICFALLVTVSPGLSAASNDPACEEDWKPNVQKLREMPPNDMVRLKESAIAGDPEAQLAWGRTFGFGIGKPEDLFTAREWYVKSAKGGNCAAQKILAIWFAQGKGGSPDPQEAYKWNLKLAERGFWPSQINVGSMLMNGRGVDKNEQKGLEWLLRAADENDSANGQYAVAIAYMSGRGTERDLDRAEAYARRAAEKGFTAAEQLLSEIQQMRTGSPSINLEAESKLAEEGDAGAQFTLGMEYRKGRFVPLDLKRAINYLEQAARQGFPLAEWALGEMYETGEGLSQDYEQAFDLYRSAAERGVRQAQYRLGLMYERGIGRTPDMKMASFWYGVAAHRSYEEARARKAELDSQLRSGDRTAAEKMTKAYFVAHPDQDTSAGGSDGFEWRRKLKEPETKKADQ